MPPTALPTLAIENLSVRFGDSAAVRDVSLWVESRECVGVVGESGSGKTQVFMAAMGLLPSNARVHGSVRFEGTEILGVAPAVLNRVRGSKLTMIFQDPMTSLTPHLRIGVQLAEVLEIHTGAGRADAERAALVMLERVRIPEAKRRLRQYPHELSGGMRQRVMIAMSLLCEPSLVIADEPTTALDVTVQAQILDTLRVMRAELGMGIVLISHDMGVVAGLADRIVVLYAGRIVEQGPTAEMLRGPEHPYTAALLSCVPALSGPRLERMPTLPGQAPDPSSADRGCAFAPRCARAAERCRVEMPQLRALSRGREAACHFPLSA
jgi:oligopeptide transport system ATP-binding protein